MRFRSEQTNGKIVVYLEGELDEKNAPEMRAYLDKIIRVERFQELILDFQKVDFMDSTGIGVLLGRYKTLLSKGLDLHVRNLNAQIDKVFRVSGLYQIIKAV